jgi:pimeloyl-ACP methyl ester carboxylesterase
MGCRAEAVVTHLAHDDVGSGSPVVFLHGMGCDRYHWQPVVQRLADRNRCLNVDLVGHGDSPHDGPADLFGQAVAVAGLLADLDVAEPVLVGHSFGAGIALALTSAHPCRGVVNVDQPLDPAAIQETLITPREQRLRGGDFEAAFAEIMEGLGLAAIPAERQQLAREHIRPRRGAVLEAWAMGFDTPPAELAAQIRAVLPTVVVPYLGLFSDQLSEQERSLQRLIPNSTIEVWPGHSHWLQLVDPDRMADRIDAFATSLG